MSNKTESSFGEDFKGFANNFYVPRHNYFTRYSAKFSTPPNSCQLHTPNSSLTSILLDKDTSETNRILYDYEDDDNNDNNNNNVIDYNLNDDNINNNIDSESHLSDASYLLPNYPSVNFIDIFETKMRVREYQTSACTIPYGCAPPNKWLRAFIFFVSIGMLALAMFYITDQYSKSCDSMSIVTSEINTIKKQVDGMKDDVNNVVKIRDSTEKKLNVIESMLKEMHATHKENDCSTASKLDKSEPVKSVVQEMLDEYDADKTGKTDFALESAGGSIVHTFDTETYLGASNTLTLFGVPLCESSNNPRAMIQPGMSPGQCWAFKGSRGKAIIKLLTFVRINGVTLEHISKNISPSGEISTAPKEFSIWGAFDPEGKNEKLLGQFTYDIDNKPSRQYFPINDSASYHYVTFKIHSNHGNMEFTCVYRVALIHYSNLPRNYSAENDEGVLTLTRGSLCVHRVPLVRVRTASQFLAKQPEQRNTSIKNA